MYSVLSQVFLHILYCTGNFVLNIHVYLIIGGKKELVVIYYEPKTPSSAQVCPSPKWEAYILLLIRQKYFFLLTIKPESI